LEILEKLISSKQFENSEIEEKINYKIKTLLKKQTENLIIFFAIGSQIENIRKIKNCG
jgi:hypothetical protein